MAKYNRIKDLREDCDKTQQELADYLGTSSQHYGKYELGNAEIPFERAIMLAKYYNVSLDYIAGLTTISVDFLRGASAKSSRSLSSLSANFPMKKKPSLKSF